MKRAISNQTGLSGLLTASLVLASLGLAFGFLGSSLASNETPKDVLFWFATAVLSFLAVWGIRRLAAIEGHAAFASLTATVFGLWIVYFWQLLTVALDVPRVLLPAPWLIMQSLWEHVPTLTRDFFQTVVKAVVTGWVLGCSLGFGVALAIDRLPFLQRGLLPIASLTSTIPLVGVAPIAVMWFGFDWQPRRP
jgi:NitT/TauT family transport system permease protein